AATSSDPLLPQSVPLVGFPFDGVDRTCRLCGFFHASRSQTTGMGRDSHSSCIGYGLCDGCTGARVCCIWNECLDLCLGRVCSISSVARGAFTWVSSWHRLHRARLSSRVGFSAFNPTTRSRSSVFLGVGSRMEIV